MVDPAAPGGVANFASIDVLNVVGMNGGASADVLCADGTNGGAMVCGDVLAAVGVADLSPSLAVIEVFSSLIASLSFPVLPDTSSFSLLEPDVINLALYASIPASPLSSHPFNLSKLPFSYSEAMACPDASVWRAAMDWERQSLVDMGAFEEANLPPGQKAIGLKWVYNYKTDPLGVKIKGKEKACLVAQGYSQHPGQYGETYAPVAKLASIHVLLTWAAVHDLDIF